MRVVSLHIKMYLYEIKIVYEEHDHCVDYTDILDNLN